MSTITELINRQTAVMDTIHRTLRNFKKLGKEKMTAARTRQRMALLKESYDRSQQLNEQIVAVADQKSKESLPYFTEDHYLACEDAFLDAYDYMADLVDNAAQDKASTSTTPTPAGRSSFRLPQLCLPTFDGSCDQWEAFRDKFCSMVIRDTTISGVERMHYLASCLSGEASRAIEHLDITESTFPVAWKILMNRYENKRRLINVHLAALYSLPSITRESPKDLRSLVDRINSALQSLKNLGRPVDTWDDLIVYFATERLDFATRKAWEINLGESLEYPKFRELTRFLEGRMRALESIDASRNSNVRPPIAPRVRPEPRKNIASHSITINPSCPACNHSHLLYQCDHFRDMSVSERFALIKKSRRCINCFSVSHNVQDCTSSKSCKECGKRHHTLLHQSISTVKTTAATSRLLNSSRPSKPNTTVTNTEPTTISTHTMSCELAANKQVLLATALVRLYSPRGFFIIARALIDQGSAVTVISENLVQILRLHKIRRSFRVSGVGDLGTTVNSSVEISLSPSEKNEPIFRTTALIMKRLTRYVPTPTDIRGLPYLADLPLADPNPESNGPIELIIGADLYGHMLLDGIRKGHHQQPIAQNSILGWIISGPTETANTSYTGHFHHLHVLEALDESIRRFWEIEDVAEPIPMSADDLKCENHFKTTHSRTKDGRYKLRLPFKKPPTNLGESRFIALRCLTSLEQRLQRDPTTDKEYRDFMSEYLTLGHMTRSIAAPNCNHAFYIPHHAVVRKSSATTHLRVVFNASRKSGSGMSLNDILYTGPKLQQDLIEVLLRWRQHQYVYTADIEKMYRQILVDERDQDYQRILWRDNSQSNPIEYRLTTVTYGTAPAPYLALRTLHQLAEDEGSAFREAVSVIRDQSYVDDFLFGGDSIASVRQLRDQLKALLARGCFSLRKWASNSPELLTDIDPTNHGLATLKTLCDRKSFSVLGLAWSPSNDAFHFRISVPTEILQTKRAILSTISKIFDPLGWLSPLTIVAKLFMQSLWLCQCDWDEVLPIPLIDQWEQFRAQLPELSSLSIPRKMSPTPAPQRTFHGFSDASTKAYAACIYMRSILSDGTISVSLLAAKTRVAPLKSLSVPRLELSAALLLSRLFNFVSTTLQTTDLKGYCWTDSTITLAWLKQPPTRWKTFVANRVAKIQQLTPNVQWGHVPTNKNPADCASRGLTLSQLKDHQLWWSGPSWLCDKPCAWPQTAPLAISAEIDLEEKQPIATSLGMVIIKWDLQNRYSSWTKLLRVTAYVLKFARILTQRIRCRSSNPVLVPPFTTGHHILTPKLLRLAKTFWLRRVQLDVFPEEMQALEASKSLKKPSPILSLNPYLDEQGLLRARGRLANSQLSMHAKQPIILRSHPIVSLIIDAAHKQLLHAGPTLTLAHLRQEYWILRSRATVRAILHNCIICTREKAAIPTELMGDLPAPRVTQTERPFVHTGVDYAGPILIRTSSGRGHKSHKAYIAVFICLTVKALHLELVSDYTSSAFLAAYHRFTSRRGIPTSMYSDNGTTFQGADREIQTAFRSAVQSTKLGNHMLANNTQWHFLPPSAPHFGGLWEAAVKSVKYHLKRSIGEHMLTFEELITYLCRIEACLNSRPLSPMSDCIDDYTVLTPGHFLIGASLFTVPEPSLLDVKPNRLSRWQLLQRITETFWKSWSNEYLHSLHQRPKWRTIQNLAKVGQLVLLRHQNQPPSRWALGRIVQCHPGSDRLVRVVTVKTATSEYKRPLSKLCFLPIQIENVPKDEPGTQAEMRDPDVPTDHVSS